MTPWPTSVRKALQDARVLAGISQVCKAWMQNHIRTNEGRAAGGATVPHAPLKAIAGRYWKSSKPKGVPIAATRKKFRMVEVKRKMKDGSTKTIMVRRARTEYQVLQPSYRTGGQPLRDTTKLMTSLGANASASANQIGLVMQGAKYGIYQDRGFTTKGPIHYIPLTLKGNRQHARRANPETEGLVRGKDYMLLGSKKKPKRITVPARPFLMPTRTDMKDFGRSLYLGLRSVLKGK